MTDTELAAEVVARLNALVANPRIREDVGRRLRLRAPCGPETSNHPTIQVRGETWGPCDFGFLGLLNGIVGVGPDGQGLVSAIFDGPALKGFIPTGAP